MGRDEKEEKNGHGEGRTPVAMEGGRDGEAVDGHGGRESEEVVVVMEGAMIQHIYLRGVYPQMHLP